MATIVPLHRHPSPAKRLSDLHFLTEPVQPVLFLGHGTADLSAGVPVDVPE
jgi:hypothetical protein